MTGADAFLRHYFDENPFNRKEVLQVTHGEFWESMVYFLSRTNEKFRERRKAKLAQMKKGIR